VAEVFGIIIGIVIIFFLKKKESNDVVSKVAFSYLSLQLDKVYLEIESKDSIRILKDESYLRNCITSDLDLFMDVPKENRLVSRNRNCENSVVVECLVGYLAILNDKSYRHDINKLDTVLKSLTNEGK